MKRHIALTGFMAAGKSTIGRLLARRLGARFVDLDARIERRHGRIAKIFASEGEARFRRYEVEELRGLLDARKPSVIALGGGAVTSSAVRALLRRYAHVVFVQVALSTIVDRLRRVKATRPLAGRDVRAATLRAMYRGRLPFYRAADMTVRAGRLTPQQIASKLYARLQRANIEP